jgi:hypothetical protein
VSNQFANSQPKVVEIKHADGTAYRQFPVSSMVPLRSWFPSQLLRFKRQRPAPSPGAGRSLFRARLVWVRLLVVSALFDSDRYHFADNGWIVRDMVMVTKHQLKRVATRRQRNCRFCLAVAKVTMLIVGW